MTSERLRVGLVGTGGFGANALRALTDCPLVELAGVADIDPSAAARAAAQANCACYTDNRRLLAETKPQGVFLAVPPAAAGELVRLARQRGVHVWRETPAGRNLSEAVALARDMESASLKLAVGTQRRFMAGYRRAKDLLGDLGRVYCLEARYHFNWGPALGWRGDKTAGGGVLASLGYHMFDLALWLLGLPQTVYSIAGTGQLRRRSPPQATASAAPAVYDTEDTAAAAFRYPDKTAATILVSRCFDPVTEGLTIYGEAGTLAASPGRCVFRDRDGAAIENFEQEEPPAAVFLRQVEAFVRAVIANARRYECSGRESLLTMAAIDAAYLSDQTGNPESPAGLLAGHDLTPADCLQLAPADREES